MAYYIYENWVAESKAVIHHASCGYCNDGLGCHDNILGNKNGKWHGPFSTSDEAAENAKTIGRPVKHCHGRKCR